MKRISVVVVSLMAAGALAGCGSVTDREQAASAAAVRLLTAVDGKDGRRGVCRSGARYRVGGRAVRREPCAQAILDEDLPKPGTVTGAQVYGQWAQVRLSDDTVFVAVFPGGWRVVAAGCDPRGDRPYDCTVQGG